MVAPEAYLTFFRDAGALKDTIRNSWTANGRRESVAEHSWRLALMALTLEDELPGVDHKRVLQLLLLHDLGEAIGGDVPAPMQVGVDKTAVERADLARLLAPLPPTAAARLNALWEEAAAAVTPEARLAKGLDRLETVLQHVEGANPPDFDYAFNMGYGRAHTDGHPLIAALRAKVDSETADLGRKATESGDAARRSPDASTRVSLPKSARIDGQGEESGLADLRHAYDTLRRADGVPGLSERRAHLLALRAEVRAAATELAAAVDADFGGRPRQETMLAEVAFTLANIDWTLKRLKGWTRPLRVRLPVEFLGASGRVERVPLGVVGILAPWNYPVQLALLPLVAALAGGNRVLLRPSEHTPRTSALLARVVARGLPGDKARVVEGGPEVAAALTALPLDGIFYTGSAATGRKVLAAAAANLTPVTLELGGKSPAVLLDDADLALAAASIMAGKLFSAGQTCVAPDYLLVPRARMEAVITALQAATARLYPDPEGPQYAAIAQPSARARLSALLEGQRTAPLMARMPSAPKLGAFAVLDPAPDSPVMREEIFGPILPLVPYDGLGDVAAFVNARPCPLALYVYGRDRTACEGVVARVRSGGAMINDCLLHVAAHPLPFGGAGESGMGAYHGEEGFRAFTRPRSVMIQSRLAPARLARPPYGAAAERLIRFLLR